MMTPAEIAKLAEKIIVECTGMDKEAAALRDLARAVHWLAVCQQEVAKELAKRYVESVSLEPDKER